MVADNRSSESRPFSALSKEGLKNAMTQAEENLRRQRAGLEASAISDEDVSAITLGPKGKSPTTVGPPWEGETLSLIHI